MKLVFVGNGHMFSPFPAFGTAGGFGADLGAMRMSSQLLLTTRLG